MVAVGAVVLALAFVGPAAAGAGDASAQDVMVPAPPGFQPFTGEGAFNGPINRHHFELYTSPGALDDVPKDEVDKMFRGSWSRHLKHESSGSVLVTFGYRLPSDGDAAAFANGAVTASRRNPQAVRTAAGDGFVVYKLAPGAGAESHMSLVRQGRYLFQFVVAAPPGHADQQLADTMARRQLDLLPAGSRSFEPPEEPVTNRLARAMPIVLALLLIAALVNRSNRKRRRAEAAVDPPAPAP